MSIKSKSSYNETIMIIKAIILMGGSGSRFGSDQPKQFHYISDKKIYIHTLERFLESGLFDEIILVSPEGWIEKIREELPSGPILLIKGGRTRQESSYLGLLACGKNTDFVSIHDAVRPFVSQKILKANIEAVKTFQAVNTCIPSTDTLIHKSSDETVLSIPSRSDYMRAQTPQSFAYSLILRAHECTIEKNASDDCQLLLRQGHTIKIVQGDESNMKITNPLDLFLAEQLFRLQ